MPTRARTTPEPTRRRYVTLNEAADYLAVDRRTVRNMIADGRLTGYRLGRLIRLNLDEIDSQMVAFGGNARS
ncbi:excisionase family DNA-binding protein [Mycolicibacterium fortuitum]|uniref:excisionase family DNA-binding protein n=1 Tax=Mycolicibacterium fortuitum TaxID=1766 RepID=UPI0007EAE695|nr:excisionase family DNA-binding protein [Mycolicibacterium fortuitum]OBG50174.1 DNA-binding protein [Mycolicibacterium fortuitum]